MCHTLVSVPVVIETLVFPSASSSDVNITDCTLAAVSKSAKNRTAKHIFGKQLGFFVAQNPVDPLIYDQTRTCTEEHAWVEPCTVHLWTGLQQGTGTFYLTQASHVGMLMNKHLHTVTQRPQPIFAKKSERPAKMIFY